MAFLLFLLLNATLFIRPTDFVADWKGISIYEYLIIGCIVFSIAGLVAQFWEKKIFGQPLTMMVLCLLPIIFFSGLRHGFDLTTNSEAAGDFIKTLVYYFLLVTTVTTPKKLRIFLLCLTLLTTVMVFMVVLDFHDTIDIPNLKHLVDKEQEDSLIETVHVRLSGTGIFGDPNDICMLFVLAVPLCVYFMVESRVQLMQFFWALPLGLFAYATYLTKSRGGFLAILVTLVILLWSRFGQRVAWVLTLLTVPLMVIFFAGRATNLTGASSAHSRFQMWQIAVVDTIYRPAFGIGIHKLEKEEGLVAHNSYLQCYCELGVVGGTIFLGAFLYAFWLLWKLNSKDVYIVDPESRALNPYLMAIMGGYIVLMMSLTRSYLVMTYMMLAFTTAHLNMVQTVPYQLPMQLNTRIAYRLGFISVAFLAVMYVALRIVVRY